MREKLRHFELIQLLRAARRPVTAARLAAALEVTTRTIYRDIAALRALRVPVAGEAGVGYVLDAGFDLPPIAFDIEEVEALSVALAMLERTGDSGLKAAARRIEAKIDAVLSTGGTGSAGRHRPSLVASDWGAEENPVAPMPLLRRAVREATRLEIRYRDEAGRETDRLVAPVALIYYVEAVVLAAWCSLRHDFRHFRTDRILACRASEPSFREAAARMRAEWRLQFEGAPRQKP